MFDIQTHVKSGYRYGSHRGPAKTLQLANSLTLSVQAGIGLYSLPRNNEGPYTAFEVGFPSMPVSALEPYRDSDSDVYAYVPLAVLEQVFEEAGGVVSLIDSQE